MPARQLPRATNEVRRKLMHECELHTVLRLPTGIFYAQGVKANVVFFDRKPASEKPWTKEVWFYDLRNQHFTLKESRMTRGDLDEFVECYRPGDRNNRTATCSENTTDGRWRCYTYDEIISRDKASLDIFWLRDDDLEDSANLPDPHSSPRKSPKTSARPSPRSRKAIKALTLGLISDDPVTGPFNELGKDAAAELPTAIARLRRNRKGGQGKN